MLIRKLFKYEMSHRVVGAFTKRCSENIHGHSYKLEILFSGNVPDDAHMVMDFGFVKKYFHPFVDSFDHSHMLWTGKRVVEDNYIVEHNERWITAPFSSTAEMQAKMFHIFSKIAVIELKKMGLINGGVSASGAIVHETDTGYADYRSIDEVDCMFPEIKLKDILFSSGIQLDWPREFTIFYNKLLQTEN